MSLNELHLPNESVTPGMTIKELPGVDSAIAVGVDKVGEALDSEILQKASVPIGKVAETVVLASIPGGQALVAGQIVKEVAKTAAKEGVKYAARVATEKIADETDGKYAGMVVKESASMVQDTLLGVHSSANKTDSLLTETSTSEKDSQSVESTDSGSEDRTTGVGVESETRNANVNMSDDLVSQIESADGDLNRLDDNGLLIKDEEGRLFPNIEYEVNGNRYVTDDQGRIKEWEADLSDTPNNERDGAAQREVGGGGDNHGGHLVARINGGSSGSENMVPMRGTINSGDYLRVEKQENKWLTKDGLEVQETGELVYEGDGLAPSQIEKHVYVDGVERIDLKIDNTEGSTKLLDELEGEVSQEQMEQVRNLVEDMKSDGCTVSVTSYTKEFAENGDLQSIRIDYRNESAEPKPIKDHITFEINSIS